eukprot:TRINITY_DN120618_c0_g1_i1.p5 TRINITY_DN120618_c0_g1~~TRINITY_DN120618_c0_g1_i1.p5  ORF type:complete len:148 (+),score=20.30 TRINITY_DN120618_c0_g1_i1:406-849(+)
MDPQEEDAVYERSSKMGQPLNGLEEKEEVTLTNGAVYKGQWLGQMRHGYGVQVWPDGARYEGNWRYNKAHGKGKFFHVEGDVYEGDWVEDKVGYLIKKNINRHMGTEFMYTLTEQSTRDTGKTTSRMAMELKFGTTIACMKDIIERV